MKPLLDGATVRPVGNDGEEWFWHGAYLDTMMFAVSQPGTLAAFKRDTGHDLDSVIKSRGINAMIDEATGYQRKVIVAWFDWFTMNVWGEEGAEEETYPQPENRA